MPKISKNEKQILAAQIVSRKKEFLYNFVNADDVGVVVANHVSLFCRVSFVSNYWTALISIAIMPWSLSETIVCIVHTMHH